MMKRLLPALLFLAAVPLLNGESLLTIDMQLYNTVMRTRDASTLDPYWAYGMAGTSEFSVKSTDSGNVKGELSFDFNLPDISGIPVITLKKAYVKARFPSFRLTVGKTRLGWGDGFVFNSGDVIFGSISPDISLIGTELRTDTAWLTSVNIPLDRFAFIEAVVKAPEATTGGLGDVRDLGAGARAYAKLGSLKMEVGYFFDGTEISGYDLKHTSAVESLDIHSVQRPYLSIQGNLGADFYLNGSVAIADSSSLLADLAEDTFNISCGLFYMAPVGYGNSLSFRLESAVLPFLNWRESDGPAGSYALLLYPEITFAYGQGLSLSLRSVVSPIDLSAMITGGFSWNVFQGFNLLAYANFFAGDGNDTFSWSKDVWDPTSDTMDGISFMAGIEYIY